MYFLRRLGRFFLSLAFFKALFLTLFLIGLWLIAKRLDFSLEGMQQMVQSKGALLSAVVFIGIFIFVSIAPISARDVLKVLGVALFGPWLSATYLWLADLIAAVCTFFLSKWLGRDLVERLVGRRMGWINQRLEEKGLRNMVILRLLPVPYRHLNFLSGVTRISFKDFFLGTAIGGYPRALFGQLVLWPFIDMILSDQTQGARLIWIAMGGIGLMMVLMLIIYALAKKFWPNFFRTTASSDSSSSTADGE